MTQMVQHHVKYKEIHGMDEIKLMTVSEHKKLHNRLRNENKCIVPSRELQKISRKAYHRTAKFKETKTYLKTKVSRLIWLNTINRLVFSINTILGKNLCFYEMLRYNCSTNHIAYVSYFAANHGFKLYNLKE